MDDPLFDAARRIVEENQKARSEFAGRASRLADALITGGDEFSEAVNDILDEATGTKDGAGKDGEVLGQDGSPQSPDGDDHGSEPQAGT